MPKEIKLSNIIIDILVKITKVLKKHRIPYAIIGGIALQSWGRERSTRDIDITISLGNIERKELLKFFEEGGVELVFSERQKGLGSFSLLESQYTVPEWGIPIEIDFFIARTGYQKQLIKRATLVTVMGNKIKLVRAEDLIILKLLSGRLIDRIDVKDIIVEQKPYLDKKYLFSWAYRFDISRRLEDMWKEES